MADNKIQPDHDKALPFFLRAEEVASTGNYDYAIEMYIEGLKRCPDALQYGHAALRKLALLRQGRGGKRPSIKEKMKFRGGKTPADEMLNAEHLLAKDPDNLNYAEIVLNASVAGAYHDTAEWIASLVFEANRSSEKPSLATYLLLKDSYVKLSLFTLAVSACKHAIEMKPDDDALVDELRNLSAQMTLQNGKYDGTGDFTKSIKNKEEQDILHVQDKAVKSFEERFVAVDEAKKALAADPGSTEKILTMSQALYSLETEQGVKDASSLLERAYAKTKDFVYKKKLGELKLKQLRLELRNINKKLKVTPDDQLVRMKFTEVTEKLNNAELDHYGECVKYFPTDLYMKYEYGLCLIKNKRYDDAIPFLQEAQRDPRRRVEAMDETGLCFFLKGWYADAIDIFQGALDACEVKDNDVAKDIRYNLARTYEEDGQVEKALEYYRKLAQLDFRYKDVSQRVDKLRNQNK